MYDLNLDFCVTCTHLCEIKIYNIKHIEHFIIEQIIFYLYCANDTTNPDIISSYS